MSAARKRNTTPYARTTGREAVAAIRAYSANHRVLPSAILPDGTPVGDYK